jgi:hypothetical protein
MAGSTGLTNLESLARIIESIGKTGEPSEELVWPEFEIHEHQMPDSPLHKGTAGWRRWVGDWAASFPEWEIEAMETAELDERRILTTHKIRVSGRSTGMRLEERHAQLWQFRDGRLERMDYFGSEEDARNAAGAL